MDLERWSREWGTFTVIWLAAVLIGLLAAVLTRPAPLTYQVCTPGRSGYCLSDWGGGPCPGGRVTLTCPFSDPALNREFLGRPVGRIAWTGDGSRHQP